MGRIAILGGTGPEGMGLGLRFALCGEEIVLGSRQAARAQAAADEARARLASVGCRTPVHGAANETAIEGADMVVLAFPFAGVAELLPALAGALAGKIVLDVVNPLTRAGKTFVLAPVPEGSAAEAIQRLLPGSLVVSGFKNESAEALNDIERECEGDIVISGDHPAARDTVAALVRRVPRYRPVDAGGLINARFQEAITALLLNINRKHKAVTSIEIVGLPDDPHDGRHHGPHHTGQRGPQT
jgi:NADPH-dependent F420 reductase